MREVEFVQQEGLFWPRILVDGADAHVFDKINDKIRYEKKTYACLES